MYRVMMRGFKEPVGEVFMKEGDVWKFGQTMRGPARYPISFYKNTGAGLKYNSEFSTQSFKSAIQMERNKILTFEEIFGELPPGNKIRR